MTIAAPATIVNAVYYTLAPFDVLSISPPLMLETDWAAFDRARTAIQRI